MPGMDGFEVCERLKALPKTRDVPVVMVTALDQPEDRVRGLRAGADDFLAKPLDEVALITRVKNLARVKTLNDEMLARAATGAQLGLAGMEELDSEEASRNGEILLVDHRPRSAQALGAALSREHSVVTAHTLEDARVALAGATFDLLITNLDVAGEDGLRLCSQTRSVEATRHLPLLLLCDANDQARLLRGLDLGVNDYVIRPIENSELQARVRTQLRKKRYSDYLRNQLDESVQNAAIDPLTRLHNRRYFETHVRIQIKQARDAIKPFSLLIADIDYFKSVNDTFGHDIGDVVLRTFAERLASNVRGRDLAARLGGEEFVIAMPDTGLEDAMEIAERLRASIDEVPFTISQAGEAIRITASLGVASLTGPTESYAELFKRADRSVYRAKACGRNQVEASAA